MVILLPNQAIAFQKNGESFNDYNYRITTQKTDYCQAVRNGELTYFQVQVTPETGTNLITNGDFLTNLNFWTQTPAASYLWDGTLGAVALGVVSSLSQNIILTANRTHRIDFEVTGIIDGAKVFVTPLVTHSQIGGTALVDFAMGTGTYSLYFIPSVGGLQQIAISNIISGKVSSVRNISVYELSEPVWTLRDCETQTPQASVGVVQRFEDKITYSASWTSIPDGCYNICLENSGDFEYNYAERDLCLNTESGESILQEDGDCITWM